MPPATNRDTHEPLLECCWTTTTKGCWSVLTCIKYFVKRSDKVCGFLVVIKKPTATDLLRTKTVRHSLGAVCGWNRLQINRVNEVYQLYQWVHSFLNFEVMSFEEIILCILIIQPPMCHAVYTKIHKRTAVPLRPIKVTLYTCWAAKSMLIWENCQLNVFKFEHYQSCPDWTWLVM